MYYTVFCFSSLWNCYLPVGDRMSKSAAARMRQALELDDQDVEVIAW